jgi:hypothetical protein
MLIANVNVAGMLLMLWSVLRPARTPAEAEDELPATEATPWPVLQTAA